MKENLNLLNNNEAVEQKITKVGEEERKRLKSLAMSAGGLALGLLKMVSPDIAEATVAGPEVSELIPDKQVEYKKNLEELNKEKKEFFDKVEASLGFKNGELSKAFSSVIADGPVESNKEKNGSIPDSNICVANYSYILSSESKIMGLGYDYAEQMGMDTEIFKVNDNIELRPQEVVELKATGADTEEALLNGINEAIAFKGLTAEGSAVSEDLEEAGTFGGYDQSYYGNYASMKSAGCIQRYEIVSEEDLPDGGKVLSLRLVFAQR